MSKYPPHLLSCPIAQNGDKAAVPVTAQEAGAGRLSQEEGWGAWNSRPIGEGGIPPKREDFNSVLNLLSSFLVYYQQGGVMKYSASLDYEPGNEIFSATGTKCRCLVANGPNTAKGVVAPGSDKTVWKNLDAPSVIAGQITPFYNCRLGGSDGRRLIPWGESVADERYVLCDGGTDGLGGNVPNLMDKFLLPSTVAQAGQTGGSLNLSIPGVTVNGTVGETVLTVDQIPSHTHTGSTSTAGYHTHTRGSMNITGFFGADDRAAWLTDGAFYAKNDASQNTSAEGSDGRPWWRILFDASRTWSGSTSESGSHSHSITMGSTGGGRGHTHTITSSSETQTLTLDRPPFYRLAYFVKLPE
nr:MAG TPA: LONG TAIL FIBER PROTEIN P37 PROTEIN, FIBER PROTEIN.2A [Caudoviricetes sp.]